MPKHEAQIGRISPFPTSNMNGSSETTKPVLPPITTVNGNYPDIRDTESPTQVSPNIGPIRNDFDEIIPHPDEVNHRNLILCFDGTGDQFDGDVRIHSLIAP